MIFKAKLNLSELDIKVDLLARNDRLIRPGSGPPYIENATRPVKNLTTPGYRECAGGRVWLVEVGRNDWPLDDNQEYDVEVTYREPKGAWGRADSYAFVKYAFADEARTTLRTMGMAYAADIRMKPKSSFVPLENFAPFYQRLQDEYHGDVLRFARRLAMDTDDEYRKFGVLKSVLFHEYLHFRLGQIDGKLRYPDLKAKVSQLGYLSDAKAAVNALQKAVEDVFQGWHGEITYKPSENDHLFIWEEEVKYLVRSYEKTVLKK